VLFVVTQGKLVQSGRERLPLLPSLQNGAKVVKLNSAEGLGLLWLSTKNKTQLAIYVG